MPHRRGKRPQHHGRRKSVRSGAEITTTPPAARVHPIDQDGRLLLDLEPTHILDAVAWVLERVDAGEVDGYTLAPASLESLYEGITDDER